MGLFFIYNIKLDELFLHTVPWRETKYKHCHKLCPLTQIRIFLFNKSVTCQKAVIEAFVSCDNCFDKTLETISAAPTKAGKHVTSNIACACIRDIQQIQTLQLLAQMVLCYVIT